MLNAGVWLGATLFFTLTVSTTLDSEEAQKILGAQNANYVRYISDVLWQNNLGGIFYWHIVCALIALLHLVAEWLYLGRTPAAVWRFLLGLLLAAGLFGGIVLTSKIRELHERQHRPTLKLEERQAAVKSLRTWRGIYQAMNVLLIVCISVHLWRAANPSDELRFVGSPKFRG
jgi:hypothetical protein